jgi:hypothetical protein
MTLGLLRSTAFALLAVSAPLLGLSIVQAAKSRRAPYYAQRRKALGRCKRTITMMWSIQALALVMLTIELLLRPVGLLPP